MINNLKFIFTQMANGHPKILNRKMFKWILSVTILICTVVSPSLADQPSAKFESVRTEIVTSANGVNRKRIKHFKKKSVRLFTALSNDHYNLCSLLYEQLIITRLIENCKQVEVYVKPSELGTIKHLPADTDDYLLPFLKG
jgi:hypothetical protein